MDEKDKEAIAWQWLYSDPDGRKKLEKEHDWLTAYLNEYVGKDWKNRLDENGWNRRLT